MKLILRERGGKESEREYRKAETSGGKLDLWHSEMLKTIKKGKAAMAIEKRVAKKRVDLKSIQSAGHHSRGGRGKNFSSKTRNKCLAGTASLSQFPSCPTCREGGRRK